MRIPLCTPRAHALIALALSAGSVRAQNRPDTVISRVLLVPDAVWDGVSDSPRSGWAVLVRGNRIESVGPAGSLAVPEDVERMKLPGATLIPGLIE
jgi:imidazolonepropionase-like amidohydrolase